jgi:predicted alpha/beta superfamily hydrolase
MLTYLGLVDNQLKPMRVIFRTFFLFIVVLTSLMAIAHASQVTLTFNVPASTPADSKIYLTGAGASLCNWKTDCIEMQEIQPGVYQKTILLPDSQTGLEFKVTRGSFDNESADAHGNALSNSEISVTANASYVQNVVNWKDLGPMGITGNVQIYQNIASPQLGNERNISVWFPEDYDSSGDTRYPVIYMHDGQNVFDPSTSTNGVDWGMDETMARLTEAGTVPGAIVVAVDCNPQDRSAEYDYTQKGSLYADFLIQTVKPMIDARFRTLPDRDHTFVMGSSMGALISLALVWHHPEVFSRAAGLSLPGTTLNKVVYKILGNPQQPSMPVRIYMDYGDQTLDAAYLEEDPRVIQFIQNAGFDDSNFTHLFFPYAGHSEADWSRRLAIPTQWILSN